MIRSKVFGTMAVVAGLGLSGAGPAAATADPPRPALEPTRLVVDLSERTLYLYHDGEVVNTYDVAVGEPEHPTPKGDFTISRIIWNPAWVPPPNAGWAEDEEKKAPDDDDNPMVGAKLFFEYPDYYIHGTDATHTLGEAASHGCVRMDPDAVKDLAKWVQEHGGEPRGEAWFRRVGRDDRSSHEVRLPDAVRITVRE